MSWLDSVFKNEYTMIRVLKKTDDKTIVLYRHKKLNKELVYRCFKGDGTVYRLLQKIKSENLPEIYSVSEADGMVYILEEFIDGITVGDILSSGLYNEQSAKARYKPRL